MATTRRTKAKADDGESWRNRIIGSGTMTVEELEAHPKNPRLHGKGQKAAMSDILDDIGFVAPIIVNKTTGRILDGHMRVDVSKGVVPVSWVELSEAEEDKVLATFDPIGSMATYDPSVLSALSDGMSLSDGLAELVGSFIPAGDSEKAVEPKEVELKPLSRAHVLISVPLDLWDQVSPILDQLGELEGVDVASTVN